MTFLSTLLVVQTHQRYEQNWINHQTGISPESAKSHLSCSRSLHRFYSLHFAFVPHGSLPSRDEVHTVAYSTPPANTPRCSRIRESYRFINGERWISTGKCRKRRYSHFSTSPTTCRKIRKTQPLFQETTQRI